MIPKLSLNSLAGVSRSATFAIAFVMYYTRSGMDEAWSTVKQARPVICPNVGFVSQLQKYESVLRTNEEKRSREKLMSSVLSESNE